MKFCIILLMLIAFSINTYTQPDSIILKKSINQLNQSLLTKDTTALKTLITSTLTFGHSNGWLQNSKSLIADLYNGKLSYTLFDQQITDMSFDDKTAWVRATANVAGVVDGTAFAMKLNILQVWIVDENKTWRLLARQSVKII